MKNYIRYAVHKKKTLLKDASLAFDGIVVPANILLYQYKATPGAVVFLKKPFFIDPMSYLFGENYENFKTKADESSAKFKPSFDKLLQGHKLNPDVFLKMNYLQIRHEFMTNNSRLTEFVKSCLDFQNDTVENALQDAKIISPDLVESANSSPNFLIPPYFYIDQHNFDESLSLTEMVLDIAVKQFSAEKIQPLIYVNKVLLKQADKISAIQRIFKKYNFRGYVFWINDFNECTDASDDLIVSIAQFVKFMSTENKEFIFLHAGYFGMLFKYFGATGICHGLGYGEVKSGAAVAKGKGGPPPVRYYIKGLHMFLTLDKALELLRKKPELICECPICRNTIGTNPENIVNYTGEDDLADLHYLFVRDQEKTFINDSTLEEALSELELTLTLYEDIDEIKRRVTDKAGNVTDQQFLSSDYLRIWKRSLATASLPTPEQLKLPT